MKTCKNIRHKLLDYIYGERDSAAWRQMESHLGSCPSCRKELQDIKRFFQCADIFEEEIQDAAAEVDWDALAEKTAAEVFAASGPVRKPSGFKQFFSNLARPRLRPVYAALFAGVILGGALTLLFFRSPAPVETPENRMVIPAGFMETMDLEMARRQTLDYLEQSQYLLLDFVQSSPAQLENYRDNPFAARKTRELLNKKRYLNPKLDSLKMAKAKAVCDQIEFLFYELAEISGDMTPEELEQLQRLIEEKQVLLKINLVKKELRLSEV